MIDKYLEITFNMQSSIKTKIIEKTLFSENSQQIIKLLKRSPESMKILVKYFFDDNMKKKQK